MAFIKEKLHRIIAWILLIISILNLLFISVPKANANAFSQIGSSLALGSPLINPSAVSDDWNKYEAVVWGIFLSNFCVPFVDDYKSAFDTNSSIGSKGRGSKSLSFAGGSDQSNFTVIKDLTDYAINMQNQGVKPIKVSYNIMSNSVYTQNSAFHSTGASDSDGDGVADSGIDADGDGIIDAATTTDAKIRGATLRDLFMQTVSSTEFTDGTYADQSVTTMQTSGKLGGLSYFVGSETYPNLIGMGEASLPTFAVDVQANNTSKYQIVLDFRDSFDVSMVCGAISNALTGDYSDIAKELLDTDLSKYPLYCDAFGSICINKDGRYVVIIPASASQYITKEKSINLLNSLVFNAGTASNSVSNLLMSAGSAPLDQGWWGNLLTSDLKAHIAGGPSFNNNSKRTISGGMAIFYDTDSIVAKYAREQGKLKADTVAGVDNILKTSGTLTDEYSTKVHIGKLITDLFNSKLGDDSNKTQFKIEPIYSGNKMFNGINDDNTKMIQNTFVVGSSLVNFLESSGSKPRLTALKSLTKESESIEIFNEEDSIIIPVMCKDAITSSGTKNQWATFRALPNYMYQCYNGKHEENHPGSKAFVTSKLSSQETPYKLMENLVVNMAGTSAASGDKITQFIYGYISSQDNLYTVKNAGKLQQMSLAGFFKSWGISGPSDVLRLKDVKNSESVAAKFELDDEFFGIDLTNNTDYSKYSFGRLVKIYTASSVLSAVSNFLGVKDGTDFSLYGAEIYLSYLDWYGLDKNNLTGESESAINNNIVNPDTCVDDPDTITSIPSEEDMKKETLHYTYLMLHPEEGKAYRSQILMSNAGSIMWEQYQKIVYGGSDTYYYSSVATKNNTGFLSVDNYSENFMTAWFMDDYPTFALIFIVIGIILVIIVGLLKRRNISWFLIGVVLVINVVLILPSAGEIVPYVANNVVQELFENKMTYWSISEQAANAQIESSGWEEYDLNSIESVQAQQLLMSKKSMYLDRYLNIKQDISNKVTSTELSNYDELQNMKSTRWMLPLIMKQYTATEGNNDYVYVATGDKLEDCSVMYWFYYPDDAKTANTVNSKILEGSNIIPTEYEGTNLSGSYGSHNRKAVYSGYIDTGKSPEETVYSYACEAYNKEGNGRSDHPHTYFYLVDRADLNLLSITDVDATSHNNFDSWANAYSDELRLKVNHSAFKDLADTIQSVASTYDRYDRGTINQLYGYLWATESPLHYFYQTVKDSFTVDDTYGTIVAELQGTYLLDSEGQEYRTNFMFDDETHAIKDVLDLEHMFNNLIPYLYTMQLSAGGYDTESGVFEDTMISKYSVYKDNKVSWLFRSNWVTKLMENNNYNSSAIIRLKDDTPVTVANQLLPQYYEKAGRRMVFSEAQMIQDGLQEGDLSLIELKCIQINKDIYRAWTLLLNYVGTTGITREVLMRQMALDATMTFNKEFTSSGITNQALSLMPTTLDLRSISFDSVMKMLMLNVTRNTTYIYGDTMEILVSTSDLFTSFLLLAVATLCALVIPFIRNVTLGLMFFLGYFAVLRTLFKDPSEKVKTSVGYLGSHVIYLCANIAYLMGFRMLTEMTSTEEVLSVQNQVSVGNPLWCLIVVLIMSMLFTYLSWSMIKFCIKNYKDMGFTAIKGAVELVGLNISSGFESLMGKMAEAAETGDTTSQGSKSESKSGSGKSGSGKSIPNPTNQGTNSSSGASSNSFNQDSSQKSEDSNPSSADDYYYNTTGDSTYVDNDATEINNTIERGKKAKDKEGDSDG